MSLKSNKIKRNWTGEDDYLTTDMRKGWTLSQMISPSVAKPIGLRDLEGGTQRSGKLDAVGISF